MAEILVHCSSQQIFDLFNRVLPPAHKVQCSEQFAERGTDVIGVEAKLLDDDITLLERYASSSAQVLVIGDQWPEEKQIDALLQGASGYFDLHDAEALLEKAVGAILKGDIWIQRQLVPKVIRALSARQSSRKSAVEFQAAQELLQTLSLRERDVANMIAAGQSNKRIARNLEISERTVKAHLSSIFRKLNVSDRLHLAIFLNESI